MRLPLARPLSIVAAGLALAATGCKSTPCHPPSCMAESPDIAAATPAPSCQPPPCQPPPCQPPTCTSSACRPPTSTQFIQPSPLASRPAGGPAVAAAPAADPDAQARIDVLRTSVEAQQRQNAELEAKIREAEVRLRPGGAGAKPVAVAGGPAEESARRLADELKAVPGTQVLVEGGSAVAVVTDSFAPGSDKLKTNPDLRAALRAISMAMTRHPEARVTVTGHTDSTPIKASKWSDNDALSKARAEVVANALATEGVGRDRMRVDGVGPKNPMVAPEKTASDRARNRRVEVEFAFGR